MATVTNRAQDYDPNESVDLKHPKSGQMIEDVPDGPLDGPSACSYHYMSVCVCVCVGGADAAAALTFCGGVLVPGMMEIDPKLKKRESEKLFAKRYASCFKGKLKRQFLHG